MICSRIAGKVKLLLAAAIWLLILSFPSSAERLTGIAGLILDPSGARVPDAAISVVNQDTGFRRGAESDPEGSYTIASLQPGLYKITVRKDGFRTMIRFGVRVDASQAARVDFSLAVGSTQEVITVEGTPLPVRSDGDVSVGSTSGRQEIERLPVNGGGVLSFIELTPGVLITPATRGEAGQFSADGQRPNTNYFTVDGASANSGVIAGGSPAQATGGTLPAFSAIGSLHSMMSVEALDELTVRTSSTGSEFGRMPGAQVSMTSRSGTNEFHGSGVYFFRHERMAANDWFANGHGEGQAPLRVNDFAASLGGPAVKNRTFFFLAYEGIRLRQPFAWTTPVPSQDFRATAPSWMSPLLDAYPLANGTDLGRGLAEWTGRNTRPSSLDAGSARVDQLITSRVSLFVRYSDSPSQSEFGNTYLNRLNVRTLGGTAGLNIQPGGGWVLDSRINGSYVRAESGWKLTNAQSFDACALAPLLAKLLPPSDACTNLIRFSIAGTPQVAFGSEGARRQGQFQAVQSARYDRGKSSLRFGADYRRLTPERQDAGGTLSFIADSIDSLSADRNLWKASSAPQTGQAMLHELSLYVHETVRISSSLTATFGARWELSPPPHSNGPANFLNLATQTIDQADRTIWPLDTSNIAPRGGLAWRPFGSDHTVLRAGAGVYYDSSLSLATDVVNGGPLNVEQFYNSIHAPLATTYLRYGFLPNLKLPVITQWNASVEQSFGTANIASITYVGAIGRRLIRREVGGTGSTDLAWYALSTNHGKSDYHGLQLNFTRTLAHRWQGRVGYTWSHSIDDSSTEGALHWAGSGAQPSWDRGSSDFDVRHAMNGTLSYQLPKMLGGWSLDSIVRTRSGFPITVLNKDHYLGVALANAFRPNLIGGVSLWLKDPLAPGGRVINRAAFQVLADGVQGNLGRNALTGFGMWQADASLRREFTLPEKRAIEIRVEAFNVFNHPSFADPGQYLINPLFGQSTSMLNLMLGTGTPGSGLAPLFQAGAPRSVQVMLRLRF